MDAAVSTRKTLVALTVFLLVLPLGVALSAVPTAPANLTVQVTGSTVSLVWTPSTGEVLGYLLEAGSGSGLSDKAQELLGSTPALTVPGVPDGQYFVRVRAVGADGASEPSNEVMVLVGANGCTALPNPPVALRAATSGGQVTLTWSSGGGCPASNIVLSAGSAPGLADRHVTEVGPALFFTASAPAGVYYVRLFAKNAFGTSGPSNEAIVNVTSTPSALCSVVAAVLTPAPFGDPDKALITIRYPLTTQGSSFLSFTSYRRVGTQWVEYDWQRGQMVLPNGFSSASAFIDKPAGGAWRLDFRCDGQLIAQREGSG